MLKVLADLNNRAILAVDADPDTNLADVLGIPVTKTVGMVANKLKKDIEMGVIPPSMTKKDILESKVFETIVETPKFDLLIMGRTEGEGCYCMVNNLLTSILDTLTQNYDLTIMDMEAGLEHLSRRTDRDVDIMIVVVDASRLSFETAKRIKELAKEVHIDFKKIYLIGNRVKPELENLMLKKAEEVGLEIVGIIPQDDNLSQYDLKGESLLNLPKNSLAVQAMEKILKQIGLI